MALGFGMNPQQVLRTGRNGVVYTFLGIGFPLQVGFALAQGIILWELVAIASLLLVRHDIAVT